MRKNIGLESNIEKDIIKNLKNGDILYSAVYDNGFGTTETEEYIFREYIKAPGNSKGVWARYVPVESYDSDGKPNPVMKDHKNEDGTTSQVEDSRVNDISVGLFLNKIDALKAWEKVAEKIYKSAKEAVEKEVNK